MRWHHVVIFPVALAIYACGAPVLRPANDPHVMLIERAQGIGEVRAAIVRALEVQKFVAEGEEEGRIIARLSRGSYMARLAIDYNAQNVSIRYIDSIGYVTAPGAGGAVMIEPRYTDLTNRLERVLRDEIKRPAREAAAAERAERNYQAMLEAQRAAAAQAEASAAASNAATADAEANAAASNAVASQADASAARARARARLGSPTYVINNVVRAAPAVAAPAGGAAVSHSTSTHTSSSSASFTCCVNHRKYNCPDQNQVLACGTLKAHSCSAAGGC